ncbi:PKD domain-containing protein [Chitinophaga nivalis]|uniref:PKD domain-containing protein n=1 Tax=Chitinophaga nivalis TaxID=2991709 RepID=A0ABT3IR92_9BACT|nr:PKD domain-containing protein [Chitinophaga nivalis]MCW3463840.1 PKD domain-containing protein [Chitinophaga nivalis]MCW3486470.1 PKD domain-containing protein [Chitinophaga nivalis]
MALRNSESEYLVNTRHLRPHIIRYTDPLVWYTFFFFLLASLILLGFQLTIPEDCTLTTIRIRQEQSIHQSAYTTDAVITFYANRTDANVNDYTWNFNDSSQVVTGSPVYHIFHHPGHYTVTLSHNSCSWTKDIIITPPVEKAAAPSPVIWPVIEGPATVFAGSPVTFRNKTPGAISWQWQLVQDNVVSYTQATFTCTFTTPGEKIVSLMINGDTAHLVTKKITVYPARAVPSKEKQRVLPLPPPPVIPAMPPPILPTVAEAPPISADDFRSLLVQVINKEKSTADFLPYLCNNLAISVTLNDKETAAFSHFCARIYGKKKLHITKVYLLKDDHGCVTAIRITYDRKKLLGIF